jgi:hypothetical protein
MRTGEIFPGGYKNYRESEASLLRGYRIDGRAD